MPSINYPRRYGFIRTRATLCGGAIQRMVDYARENPADAEWALSQIEKECALLGDLDAEAALDDRAPPLHTWSDHDRNVPVDEQDDGEDHIGMRKDRT